MVVNKGLEKAKAYLGPPNRWLNVPSEGHKGNPSPQILGHGWVYTEEKKSLLPVGPEPGTSMSTVQCFGTSTQLSYHHIIS